MSAISAPLEVLQPTLNSSESSERIVAAKCLGLMRGYAARWQFQENHYRIDAVESVATSDLYNPETNCKSRTFTVAGKIDVHATEVSTGAKVIFDHKTTSQDIEDPNATYWRQIAIEGQVSHYMLLEFLNGNKIDRAIWDVVRKPGISPKLLAKTDLNVVLAGGRYFGDIVSADDLDQLDAEKRETPTMYASRLAFECTENHSRYFQRRAVPRLDSEITEYAGELWDHAQDLILTRRFDRNPRNSGACMTYNSPCRFLGICSGHDTPNSANWAKKQWVHNELPVLSEDGKEVLTNSRIRTFQTCRRKHFYQYEMGIERVDEEEKESLYFGSLFHQALEAYFLELQSQQRKGN